jgi:hypothetical protein
MSKVLFDVATIVVDGQEIECVICPTCPGNAKMPAEHFPLHHALKHPDVVPKPRRQGRGGRTVGKEKRGRRMSATGVEFQQGIRAA